MNLKSTSRWEKLMNTVIFLDFVFFGQNLAFLDPFYKRTKFSSLKIYIFYFKMMVKSGLFFFYFEIQRAPSELLLPNAKKSAQKGWIDLAG